MKRLAFNKVVNRKWLTKELQAANVRVYSVVQNEGETTGYVETEEADESLALPVIQAHDPNNNPEANERQALANFYNKIEGELAWIATARQQIANGKTVVDNPNRNLAQVAQVVSGMLEIVDRILVEQREEMQSAWKYVTRRLK